MSYWRRARGIKETLSKQGDVGFSVVEALVALALLGVLAVGSMAVLKNVYSHSRETQVRQDHSAIGNYFLQHTDCAATVADAGYSNACLNNQPIHIKDVSGKIIVANNGSDYDRVKVTNRCNDKGEIYLTGTVIDSGKESALLGGVPIVCSPPQRPVPPRCESLTARRLSPSGTRCEVVVRKALDAGPVEAFLVNNTQVAAGDLPSHTVEVNCPSTGAVVNGVLKNRFGDGVCPAVNVPDALSGDCLISAIRQRNTSTCEITVTGFGPELPVLQSATSGTRSLPRLSRITLRPQTVTWQRLDDDRVTTTASCPSANVDTIFKAVSNSQGTTRSCAIAVRAWSIFIGADLGDGWNQHWFVSNAIKASASSTFPNNPLQKAMHCGDPTIKRVAFENQYKSFTGRHCRGNKGRCTFTSCGNDFFQQWNGSRWIRSSACNNGCWTGHVTIIDPEPPTYTPRP